MAVFDLKKNLVFVRVWRDAEVLADRCSTAHTTAIPYLAQRP
jgi:hypothetical protein